MFLLFLIVFITFTTIEYSYMYLHFRMNHVAHERPICKDALRGFVVLESPY